MFMHKWHSYWSDFHISNLLTFNFRKMFECAYLKFQWGDSTSVHAHAQCSSTNIGLAQAHPIYGDWCGIAPFPPTIKHTHPGTQSVPSDCVELSNNYTCTCTELPF